MNITNSMTQRLTCQRCGFDGFINPSFPHVCMAMLPLDELQRLRSELAALRSDIERHVKIAADLATELAAMTDLEITKRVAEAMGIDLRDTSDGPTVFISGLPNGSRYDPLHDDAQCFALVKRFQLSVGFNGGWGCVKNDDRGILISGAFHFEMLNRAICECVSSMHLSGTLPTA